MKILALITARGGSKRLPGKNIRILGNKPLIVWSIDFAKTIPDICDILVTTDDPKIAKIAQDAGATVPWLRPSQLATDTANSVDVSIHALDWYEAEYGQVDGLLLLQPTSPFRSKTTVKRGIKLYKEKQCPIIGVSQAKSHPMWCYQLNENHMQPFIESEHMRSQDLPLAYVVNGAFYLISPKDLRTKKSFHPENILPLVIDKYEEGLDIDTEWDWRIAETVVETMKNTEKL